MYEATFSPIRIGGVEIPNRIYRPPHQLMMCPAGRISERFIAYHEARAKAGAGLLILEASSVHPYSDESPNTLKVWDDEAIEGLARCRKRIAKYPTKVFIQLLHAGYNAHPWDGSPPWSASEIIGFAHGIPALAMTQAMIDETIDSYRLAAVRAAAAGLEGIEIHAAHGYLPMQFLSANTNRRTDKYGGSLENRARFLLETLRAIRGSVPKDFAIGARLSSDLQKGGYDAEQLGRTVEILQDNKVFDFLNLSLGDYVNTEMVAGAMQEPTGYELGYYPDIRKSVKVPLLVTGRFRSVDDVDQAIRSGVADLVGMVRAQIADPDLISKTLAGKADEVRPCIACNQMCIGMHAFGAPVGCAVNVAAGHEETLGEDKFIPAAKPRKVLVVGGGVAGMEAARVAAKRGHRVTLCEAGKDLGGKVRFVSARAPKMLAMGDITFWQEAELRRLGVQIRTNAYMEVDDIEAEHPDVVILATGAAPKVDGWQRHRPGHVVKGVDKPHVLSSIDVLATPASRLGSRAVVVDDVGHYEAVAAAEYLITQGLHVTFVTRHYSFAPLMVYTLRASAAYQRLHKTGKLDVRVRATLDQIDDKTVTLFDEVQDATPEVLPADTVVLVGYNQSLNEMKPILEAKGIEVKCIGDALSPRYIEGAIRDGYMISLGI